MPPPVETMLNEVSNMKQQSKMKKMKNLHQRKSQLVDLYQQAKTGNPWNKQSLPEPLYPLYNNVNLSRKQMAQLSFSAIETSVLCGTCVGDSSLKINRGYRNARIQCRHSTNQAAWFFWKWQLCLKLYSNGLNSMVLQKADGFQKSNALGKLKITTHAREDLTALYKLLCEQNKLVIKRKWLNHMNSYFLMTLWLDDGSLYNRRQGVFCLDSTPYKQQVILSAYLKRVWKIETVVKPIKNVAADGKKQYRLFICNQKSLMAFLKLIAPIIPVKQMLYKIMFVPKNNLPLLQRWTSEVVSLVQADFKDQLQHEYNKILRTYPRSEEDIVHATFNKSSKI